MAVRRIIPKDPETPATPPAATPPATAAPEAAKGLLQSKTFWGMLLMLFGYGAKNWFDLDLSDATKSVITEQLVIIGGAILTIIGRVQADKPVDGLY